MKGYRLGDVMKNKRDKQCPDCKKPLYELPDQPRIICLSCPHFEWVEDRPSNAPGEDAHNG